MDTRGMMTGVRTWESLRDTLLGRSIVEFNRGTNLVVLDDGTILDFGFRGLRYRTRTEFFAEIDRSQVFGKPIHDVSLITYDGSDFSVHGVYAYLNLDLQGTLSRDLCKLSIIGYEGDISKDVYACYIKHVRGDALLQAAAKEAGLI